MTYNILLSLSENIIIDVHLTYKERIMAAVNYNITPLSTLLGVEKK